MFVKSLATAAIVGLASGKLQNPNTKKQRGKIGNHLTDGQPNQALRSSPSSWA